MCLPIRPMIASSLCTCVCDANRIVNRAAAIIISSPRNNACRRIRDWFSLHRRDHGTGLEDRQSTRSPFYALKRGARTSDLTRRSKSEIGVQFSPKPINEPIFFDRACVGGGERFRFLHAAV